MLNAQVNISSIVYTLSRWPMPSNSRRRRTVLRYISCFHWFKSTQRWRICPRRLTIERWSAWTYQWTQTQCTPLLSQLHSTMHNLDFELTPFRPAPSTTLKTWQQVLNLQINSRKITITPYCRHSSTKCTNPTSLTVWMVRMNFHRCHWHYCLELRTQSSPTTVSKRSSFKMLTMGWWNTMVGRWMHRNLFGLLHLLFLIS